MSTEEKTSATAAMDVAVDLPWIEAVQIDEGTVSDLSASRWWNTGIQFLMNPTSGR